MVRVLAGQLRAVGVEIRPVLLPTDAWLARLLERHDFDLGLMAGAQGPDPESLALRFGSHGPSQFMGYSNPALDDVAARGAATVDLARRTAAYFRVQEILAHDLPIAPLTEAVQVTICAHRVHGLPQAEARGLVAMNDYSLVRLDRRSDPSDRSDQ
jgi:peptide/nickel transport system substrate-binding protein